VAPVLALGDPEGYRRLCHEMLKRFGETQDAPTVDRTAKACLLLPEFPKEMERACELADRAVALGKNDQLAPWFIFGKGLADYRRGNYRAAIEELDAYLSKAPVVTPELTTCYHLVLAMALHQQGDEKAARDHLTRADKLLKEYLLDPVRLPLPKNSRYNQDWLITWLLHREAQELIDGKKTESNK
jgi:tetratricopeptide (TPR) repeat protein